MLSIQPLLYNMRIVTNLQQQFGGFVHVPCHAGKASQNAPESISERLKFKNFLWGGGGHAPRPPLVGVYLPALFAMLVLPFSETSRKLLPPPLSSQLEATEKPHIV